MNVSEQIITILDELCEKFGFVIDWSKDNIIPYIKELCSRYIKYEIITSALSVIICIGVLVGSCIIIKQYINTHDAAKAGKSSVLWDAYTHSTPDMTIFGRVTLVITPIIAVTALLISCVQIEDIIKSICLPEIVFIEYIKSFL